MIFCYEKFIKNFPNFLDLQGDHEIPYYKYFFCVLKIEKKKIHCAPSPFLH